MNLRLLSAARIALAAAVALGGAAAAHAVAPAGPMRVWSVGPMVKIRPDTRAPDGSSAIDLAAARNEFESAQVVVRAEGSDLDGVDVEMSDLRGPGGAVIAADLSALYLETFVGLTHPSSIEGGTGEWPDPLIPKIDRYAHEKRNAFPFHVSAGRSQPVWVELFAPAETKAGIYTGSIRVSARGVTPTSVPVRLKVWSFALPPTSSLPSSFGLNGTGVLQEHRGSYTSNEDLLSLTAVYEKAALLHRLSTYGGTFAPPVVSGHGAQVQLDWTFYDREMTPLLDGKTLVGGDPLAGAKATSADVRTPAGLDEVTKAAYWQAWVRHFKQKGWLDRLYDYLWDEPRATDFPKVAAMGRAVRVADRTLPTLVTTRYDRGLEGVVSIWTPVVNCVDDKPGSDHFCPDPVVPRDVYGPELRSGKKLWWYQSCGSHGCDTVGGPYFTGWPSYVIDTNAVAHRIMEWLTWKYEVGGELYYNTNEDYGHGKDPWKDVWLHGGNGDGSLFYPGTPKRIGGRTDIPIESVRLKLIRDGFEDYEYFALLAKRGGQRFLDERLRRVVRRTYDWEHDPSVLESVRRELGEELDRGTHG